MGRTKTKSNTNLKHIADAPTSCPSAAARALELPQPVEGETLFPPGFYAELCGVSTDDVIRWFQDMPGVCRGGSSQTQPNATRSE